MHNWNKLVSSCHRLLIHSQKNRQIEISIPIKVSDVFEWYKLRIHGGPIAADLDR